MATKKVRVQKPKIYYEKQADIKLIRKKKVAIIGCGSQGHAHALNLQDSGVDVRVGLRPTSKTCAKAKKAGLKVVSPKVAAEEADVIMMLVPDTRQAKIFEQDIKPHLTKGKYLVFAHGFNILFKTIKVSKDVNVFMVAPKGPGHLVRHTYLQGSGVPALLAVHQDPSGDTHALGLSYAKAIGATRVGVLETTFKEETETDLFGEQVILCGGLTKLITTAFEVLVEAGYSPYAAYFECLHEVKLITDLIHVGGISAMRYSISDTAEWGDYVTGPRIITKDTKKEMKKVLKEIQNGKFAKDWIKENETGLKKYKKYQKEGATHLIEKVGAPLRGMMNIERQMQGGQTKDFLTAGKKKK